MNDKTLYYSCCLTAPNIFHGASFSVKEDQEDVWGTEFRPRLNYTEGDLITQLCVAVDQLSRLVAVAMGVEVEEVFNLVGKKADSLLPDPSV